MDTAKNRPNFIDVNIGLCATISDFLQYFFTITPCDECTFRVRLFADADKRHILPKLVEDPFSKEATDVCDVDFTLRAKQRTMYPGACALVYESLMQIVIKCLLGWNSDKQVGEEGIFGILKA